ncbi:MAG: hypothetical protein OXM88_05580, partial [bacterium]|nr:hypothetical protein [bacterium]
MTEPRIDVAATLADLKDFQKRTALWAYQRMFADHDPAVRFLVADEVGLGKTHVAKGVIAQVIDHLGRTGDKRHDIVYVCSNGAIARQNLRKLTPKGIDPTPIAVDRLTMLPLVHLQDEVEGKPGINLLPITPGTSLNFGMSTGTFRERAVAYTFLRSHWGRAAMEPRRARWIFWEGISAGNPDRRLRDWERWARPRIQRTLPEFARRLEEIDAERRADGRRTVRELFDELVGGLRYKRAIRGRMWYVRREFIAVVRRTMAIVGIDSLRPDLVVLDEFQGFKDLLDPHPGNLAAELAKRLFEYRDPETDRPTRTLLLSATPYRMYTTADDADDDHYTDFLDTCRFLYGDSGRVEELRGRFSDLRRALTDLATFEDTEAALSTAADICGAIASELRQVMARTERLAATPDRDGMLTEPEVPALVTPEDLRSYLRFGEIARVAGYHDPIEYWKSAPYLINFMERYKLKQAVEQAAEAGRFLDTGLLEQGPGLLSWEEVERYRAIDPQNGRLRWLLEDLQGSKAFEILWVPPSIRYYDTGSVYESEEAHRFTKRLIFSGWVIVPKVVSSLVSFEAERRAYQGRDHDYTAQYRQRGGGRLAFRTADRTATDRRSGEAAGDRRAASMTTLLLCWPSITLARLGDPLQLGTATRDHPDVIGAIRRRVEVAFDPLTGSAPSEGVVDQRWYWAAPLLLDYQRYPEVVGRLLSDQSAWLGEGERPDQSFRAHLAEARALLDHGVEALGRCPEDLYAVLAELALGGPAQCALRAIRRVAGLPEYHRAVTANAALISEAFRSFFNAPEVTAIVAGDQAEHPESGHAAPVVARYWRDVLGHCIDGNLQAVLDEHAHVLRDWLGHVRLGDTAQRAEAAEDIAGRIGEALRLRTSTLRVDIPRRTDDGQAEVLSGSRMRTRFAVTFG